MKRTISTIVLFVLLILTVAALAKIGTPESTSALQPYRGFNADGQFGTN